MMSKTVSEQWHETPSHVRGAIAWVFVGVGIGFLTRNALAGVSIGAMLAILGFVWPILHRPGRILLAFAAVFGFLGLLFATANVNVPAGLPDRNAPLGYTDGVYTCGTVLSDPIHNPRGPWAVEQAAEIANGYEKAGDSPSLISDCSTTLDAWRRNAGVLGAMTLLLVLVALRSENRQRRLDTD
jgi:hypothetical protein